MYGSEWHAFSFWWIFPVVMMVLCFFMMRGRRGAMMCGFGSRGREWRQSRDAESAMDILARRYAAGDIDKAEYEEKRRTLTGPASRGSDETPGPGGNGS